MAISPHCEQAGEMSDVEIIKLAFGRLLTITDAELSLLTADERSELAAAGREILAHSRRASQP